MSHPQWIPLSESARLQELTATEFQIAHALSEGIAPNEVHINTDMLNRHVDHLIGLGSLVVKAQPAACFKDPSDSTSATMSYATEEAGLPSGYQRPQGILRVNEERILGTANRDTFLSPAKQIQELDNTLRMGMLALFSARYLRRESMSFDERFTSVAPFWTALAAELFLSAPPLLSGAIYATGYGLAFAVDYHDARRVLGKNARPSALERKRWSLLPCGVPTERKAEALMRIMSVVNKNPKPRIAKYVPA